MFSNCNFRLIFKISQISIFGQTVTFSIVYLPDGGVHPGACGLDPIRRVSGQLVAVLSRLYVHRDGHLFAPTVPDPISDRANP